MKTIEWDDFEKVELLVGTIIKVKDFPEARKPAYKLEIDFGDKFGVKKSSVQITEHYTKDDLLGKQVLCVVNLAEKQIGPFISQVLTTGVSDEENKVVLVLPDKKVPNGSKLF